MHNTYAYMHVHVHTQHRYKVNPHRYHARYTVIFDNSLAQVSIFDNLEFRQLVPEFESTLRSFGEGKLIMEDADLWGDDDDGDHASNTNTVSWEKKLAEQDMERMRSTFAEAGYREAMMKAKDSAAENVVSGAFKQGLLESFKWGIERGRVSAMLSVIDRSQIPTESTPSDIYVNSNQLKSELQSVLEKIVKACGTPTEPSTTTSTITATATTDVIVSSPTSAATTVSNGVARENNCAGDGGSCCSKQSATNTPNVAAPTNTTDTCCSKSNCCQSQSKPNTNNSTNAALDTVPPTPVAVSLDTNKPLVETQTEVDRLCIAVFPQH
eukprot:m.10246 g.10246  ORF g.10246 m.10246 type:complete len:325 (-) comp8202_c0_seq1:152-1126(-)